MVVVDVLCFNYFVGLSIMVDRAKVLLKDAKRTLSRGSLVDGWSASSKIQNLEG